MKAIVNTKLLFEDSIIWDGALTFDNGVIVSVGRREDVVIPEDAEIIDAGGLYTAPGLIDIHNHGAVDDLFVDEPMKCCEHFIVHGATTILPTFYHDLTLERMAKGASMIRELSKSGIGRIMDGLYMEGPFMNPSGSNQKYICWGGDITPEMYEPVVAELGDLARIWAIDPCRDNIDEVMAYIRKTHPEAIFALGHSRAFSEDCRRVAKYGVKVRTHMGDGGRAPGRAQGKIGGAGCDEYTLLNPDMYAELIVDEVGIHLMPDLIKAFTRAKGIEKIILITDAVASKEKFLNNEEEGIGYSPDLNYDYRGYLSGSRLTMDNAVKNFMTHTGYGLCHAIRCATLNPARLLGIEDKVGTLEAGKKANLIIIDDTVRIKKVILEGETAVEDGIIVMK